MFYFEKFTLITQLIAITILLDRYGCYTHFIQKDKQQKSNFPKVTQFISMNLGVESKECLT